jgi:hypothetical protein
MMEQVTSGGGRELDMVGVTGSIPVAPTIGPPKVQLFS